MSKFRLLIRHREILNTFAREFVRDRTPDLAHDLRCKLMRLVAHEVEARYPSGDMAVLAKYSMASAPSKLLVYFGDRDNWTEHDVRRPRNEARPMYRIDGAFGLMPTGTSRCFGLPEGSEAHKLYLQIYALDAERAARIKADTAPFLTLIKQARNLEDVEAEWPEVGVWRERWGLRGDQLPSTLTPDALEALAAVRRRTPSAVPLPDATV